MKDVSLSLLSRGCGRFSSNKITGRHSGRLDVCLTPQDYYIWKSQNSLLQLSSRGCVLMEAESTLPKTFSTRRGPLLLYSQDLVSLETSCHSKTRDRKQQVAQQCTQQVEQQLSTLKELTASISGNSNNQFTSSRPGRPFFPPLSLPLAPDVRHLSPPLTCTMRQQSSPEHLVQMNPQRFPAEKNTERVENQPEDKEVEQGNKKRVRLGLFLQIPCTSTAPQMESQPWTHYVAITPEEETQTHLDKRLQHTESSRHAEINHHSMRGELHHPDRNCVHDMAIDHCSIQDSEATSDKGNCGRVMSANGHGNIGLLPPLTEGQSVSHGPCWEKTGKARWEGPSSDEHHAQRLPPIVKSRTVVPGQAIPAQTQRDAQPKAERVGFQSPENLNQVHQQPLFLPLLFPGKDEEIHEKQRQGKEQKERQHLKKKTGRGRGLGGARELSEKGSLVLLEEGKELPRPVGVLGCVAGWKGPGKQSSLAFLQNQLLDLQDSCQSSNDNRSVVRGILPLELRDLQNGKSVGSLILGPDGEIIQLSVYHNSQEPSQGDGGRQEQVLQVLSADGEKSPWVIVLQPEHTHTEEGMGLNTDPEGDIQQHQSRHKLLDLRRSRESHTPSSQTDPGKDPVAVAKKKTKNAEAVTETWKASKEGAKKNVWMLPLREQVGQEGPRGGNDEAEEEDKEGALGSTEQTSHLSGLHQPGLLQFKDDVLCSKQNINSNDATVEDAVDKKWKNTKRKDTEEATVTTGTTNMKTVTSAESDGQKTLRRRKEGRWLKQKTGNGAQSMRSQKQEERTTRDSTEAQHQSALPSKNKMTDREGEREVKMMNEEKEERGEMMRQKEESAGRRRRGRLKYEEAVVGNLKDNLKEKLQVENNQEVEKEPHLKSTTSPSATQRHNNKTKTNSEKGTDYLFNNGDKYSSVGSVWSLGSTASASQFNHRRLRRSAASSCEGAVPASPVGLVSSHSCLSSCSTVMVMEEKLMLNPVKSESSRPRKSQEEEATALHLAQQEERKLQEVKKKRREQEEKERAHTEEKMKNELEEERSKRAEELRLKKLAEEEERREREEEEQDQARQEQAQRERERRRKEERKRQMERLQRMREEEEQRRKAELECLHLEEERRQEEESKKLQGMDENERIEYLSRKKQEKDDRRNKEEERKRAEEEAALWAAEEARLQAQILARQMALLQQQLAFKRGLVLEAGGLEKTQGISRPWITSYFTLLQLLGLNPKKAETITP
ncbi:uncharacterized protein KIAA2012 [Chaetodon trifascialis]|uniref:uncharacterized protein KIAA2012 n=1 Tax=Chaetodon trifascialis TaxID=109706 RepID=UPI003995FABB